MHPSGVCAEVFHTDGLCEEEMPGRILERQDMGLDTSITYRDGSYNLSIT
jgi:hypothetical protein